MRLFLVLISLLVSHSVLAEAIFYAPKTKIAEVDCNKNIVTLSDIYRSTFPIRENGSKRICAFLSQFSESNGNGKAITLLTVAKKLYGDRIIEQEVVGAVDVDYIVSSVSVVENEPVYYQYCGNLGDNPRTVSKMCLRISRNKDLYFLKFTSTHTHQFYQTRVLSNTDGKISLESKNSEGKVVLTVTAIQKDETTFETQVSYEGVPAISTTLKEVLK